MTMGNFGFRISDFGFVGGGLAWSHGLSLIPNPQPPAPVSVLRPLPLITAPQAPIPSPQC